MAYRPRLQGHRVPYAALISTFEKIEATTKRLEILEILTQFLLVVAKRDTASEARDSNLLKVVYLCINRVSRNLPMPECLHWKKEREWICDS